MKKTILVTGGTGFLGNHLLRLLLAEGYDVRALKRANSNLKNIKDIAHQITWFEGDVLDIFSLEEAMQGVQHVYHCAAMVSFDGKEVPQMRKINEEGTANVVNLALDLGIEKLGYVSSIAALGRTEHNPNIDEKTTWQRSKHNSNYAISKHLGEQEVWRGLAEGLKSAVIINPSVILGIGDWHQGSCRLFQQVWDGLRFYPVGTTGFVAVEDVARAMMLLMESDISGERYIVNGANWSFKSFFEAIAKGLNKPAPTIRISPFLSGLVWRWEWLKSALTGKSTLITRETTRNSSSTYYYNGEKITRAINFQYTPLEKTIAETCAHFLKEKQLQK